MPIADAIAKDLRNSCHALTLATDVKRGNVQQRHSKYLNNMVEQDHRAVKRRTRPMLGFKSLWTARCTIAGIEVMHAIRKGQLDTIQIGARTRAEQF
jgi:transposase-like protein